MPRSRPRQAPKHYPRVAWVNEVVLAALAEELERLSDPRLGFVTLTGVEVSTDLSVADVYYSVLGTAEDRTETAAALTSAAPRLRSVLARHVRMKHLPELRFREDPSVEGGQRIDSILRDLHPDGERADDAVDPRRTGRTMTAQHEDYATALERAAKVIDAADSVTLLCHVNPDGDALGSMLGMHHALRAAGRASVASFPEPFVIAPHYRDLPGLELLTPPTLLPTDPAVVVTFDCGALGRLGDLRGVGERAQELIVVDHHVSNARYGSINVIDPRAAASGVVVRDLIRVLGLPMTRESACCLYTALVCDTGRFQYETTTSEVFTLAGELAEWELPIAQISRTLFEEHSFAYLALLGEALATMTLVREQSFVWAGVTQEQLHRHGVTMEEIEGLIDIVRRTAEADVACVLKEDVDGSIRVSLRSVGATDVQRVAAAHGGGGHRFAAGFTSDVGIDATVDRIRASL